MGHNNKILLRAPIWPAAALGTNVSPKYGYVGTHKQTHTHYSANLHHLKWQAAQMLFEVKVLSCRKHHGTLWPHLNLVLILLQTKQQQQQQQKLFKKAHFCFQTYLYMFKYHRNCDNFVSVKPPVLTCGSDFLWMWFQWSDHTTFWNSFSNLL